MTAVLELGCLFGALGAGVFADRVSRRSAVAFACAVFCIGSALQTWAKSLTQITAGRAIGGLGVGALRYGLDRPLDLPSKKGFDIGAFLFIC